MALSEKEQELLAQMEAALSAEDPRLANTLRGANVRTLHRRRATLAGFGFILGIAVLLGGIQIHWAVSVVGFVIMLASTVLALAAWRHVTPPSGRAGVVGEDEIDPHDPRWRSGDDA